MGANGAQASTATSDHDFVPASMDELAAHYYDFILGMVRKAGIPDQDAPDSVQYILERLTKTGAIGQYDPEHVVMHHGQPCRTRFSTFLGAKVLFYCRGERGRVMRRDSRELKILDAPTYEDTAGPGAGSIGDLLAGAIGWNDYSGLEAAEFITGLRARLAAVPRRSGRDTCDLVALFDEIVAEVEADGGFTYAGIQARFGISGTTAGAWLARLRQVLSCSLGRPLAVIGGVPLLASDIAAAAKILREAAGIMVAQPLKKAGHPLGKAEKGWYHPFSAEEIKKFPALDVAAYAGHIGASGNGRVKAAVIHRLERILTEAGQQVAAIPAPRTAPDALPGIDTEPEITPEEEFEARLWRGIRDAAEMDEIKALARRAFAV